MLSTVMGRPRFSRIVRPKKSWKEIVASKMMQTKAKTMVKLSPFGRKFFLNKHCLVDDYYSKMRQWKVCITICGLEYTRRSNPGIDERNPPPLDQKHPHPTQLNLIWARSILISQQSLQLSERHQFMGGNTFTQYLQAHSSPFPSIANSFLTTSGLQSVGITTIACQILALQHGQWPLHNELLFTTTETQLSAAALTSCDNYRQNISSSTYIR